MKRTRQWRVVGASVRGTGHERAGQSCQDFASWEAFPDGTLGIAVADGAGSAALGQLGAELVVRAALQTVRQCGGLSAPDSTDRSELAVRPGENAAVAQTSQDAGSQDSLCQDAAEACRSLLVRAFHAAREALEEEASRRGVPLRDLATTLIVVLAGQTQVGVAQVGDGAVVVATQPGELRALSLPAQGEYLNETVFLVSRDWTSRLQLSVWRGQAAGLAVFSDGLQMLALRMPAGIPHAPFFDPLFRFLAAAADQTEATAELERFLGSAGVRQRTDDDLTLVLAAPAD